MAAHQDLWMSPLKIILSFYEENETRNTAKEYRLEKQFRMNIVREGYA